MSNSRKTSGLALIAALGTFSTLTPPAEASPSAATARSVVVSYRHTDLGSAGAVEALYRQFAVAAERACGSYEPRNLREREDWRRCHEGAVNGAIARFIEARIATLDRREFSAGAANLPLVAARL